MTETQISWDAACILAAAEDRRAAGKDVEAETLFRIANGYDDLVRDKNLWADQSTANAKRMLEAESALLAARREVEAMRLAANAVIEEHRKFSNLVMGGETPSLLDLEDAIAALAATQEGK